MKPDGDTTKGPKDLRRRVEQMLQVQPEGLGGLSTKDVYQLLCDLQARQDELERENEALRRALEESRGREEASFRAVAQTASDAIITVDSRGHIVFWNGAAAAIFGYTVDQAVGKPLAFIMPERFRATHRNGIERVVSTASSRILGKTIEMYGLRRDGREFPIELSLSRWETGEGVFFTGIVRDISERVRAEDALRESEARWRSLVDNAPNFITIVDRAGVIEFINHPVPGITVEEVVGKDVLDFVQPEYRDLAKQKIEGVFQSGEADRYVSTALGPDGTVAWYENHLGAIKRDAQVIAVTIIATDITERMRAEETVRESEERFRIALKNSKIMVYHQDRDLRYTWLYNPQLGFTADDILGKTDAELFPPQDASRLGEIKRQVLESGVGVRKVTRVTLDGETRYHNLTVEPLRDASEAIVGITGAAMDISERVRVEEALQGLAHDLDERVKELNCLFEISRLVQSPRISLEEILQGTVNLIPAAWQYPEITCARIVLEGQEFRTENLTESAWVQTAEIIVRGVHTGVLEVYYLKERPERDEGPFLKEERSLIDAIAERLGRIIERDQADELLREQNRFITTVFESLTHPFYVIDADDYTVKMANSAARTGEWLEPVTCYALTHRRGTPCAGLEHRCPLQEVKKSGKPVMTEHIHYDREGDRKVYEVHGHPIFDSEGNVCQIIEYTLDVTERVRAEEALRRARDELEVRVQERTAELAAANDELRTIATQNARLYEAELHARHAAETLSAASLALTETLNLNVVMNTLLDYLNQLVPYDSASFVFPQDETHLVVRALRGYERWMDPREALGMTIDAQASTPIRALLTTKTSTLIPDTRGYPGWEHPSGVEQVRSWLGVPLVAGDKVIGLCALDRAEPGSFTQHHVQLAEALVSQAAVAVQNAWLFEQVRAGRERLRSLSRRLVEVQETERRYVARELHDEAGQALTSLMVGLRLLERKAEHPEAIVAGVAELKRMVDSVLENLHRLAADLRPASLDHLGLVAALRQYAEAISDRHGLVVQFEALGFDGRLPSDVETALYRVVQEALTNVLRHARATRVDVLLEQRGDKLIVIVEDNGVGFDPVAATQSGRLGLFGMRERTEMLGGTLAVESAVDVGTTLSLEVPYADPDPRC